MQIKMTVRYHFTSKRLIIIKKIKASVGENVGKPGTRRHGWALLVAQTVKNLPAVQEIWFDLWLGKIPWKRERKHKDSCLENPTDREAWWATVQRFTESDMTEQLTLSLSDIAGGNVKWCSYCGKRFASSSNY